MAKTIIKRVILFCYGNSRMASTWSNVPYLMARTLEARGIEVVRVDISAPVLCAKWANRLLRVVYGRSVAERYNFNRTALFRRLVNRKISQAVRINRDADFCIFLCFDFYNKFSAIPSLLFSDWTYAMLLERMKAEPIGAERSFIGKQRSAIEHAEVVLPLFSHTYSDMKVRYPGARIKSIDFNVVNSLYDKALDRDEVISAKLRSNYILFVGSKAYVSGLRILIETNAMLASPFIIHVVGMTSEDVDKAPEWVHFHGYMRKDDPKDNSMYYSLMLGARFMANPTPVWGAYSSIVEGMFFYNPVIVSPYRQFVEEFGANISFGFYTDDSASESLSDILSKMRAMSDDEYIKKCEAAHEAVAHYTWDNYVGEMVDLMEDAVKCVVK